MRPAFLHKQQRLPLKERAPTVPDFTEFTQKSDSQSIEKHMANFFADLNKKGGFEIVSSSLSLGNNDNSQNSNSTIISSAPQLQQQQQQPQQQQQQQQIANEQTAENQKKSFDKSKMEKINQMFAEKKKETISKGDLNDKLKNLFQKNGLSSTVVPSIVVTSTSAASTTASTLPTNSSKKGSANTPIISTKTSASTSSSEAQVVILNKKEEYDPARPNDYEQLKRQQNKQKLEMEKLKQKKSLLEAEQQQQQQQALNKTDGDENNEIDEEYDDFSTPALGLGAKSTYPPPIQQMEIEKDTGDLYSKSDYESSEEKAYKLMSKQGFKLGQGLGKLSQGIVAPIIAQKISDTSAIITQSTMDLSTVLSQEFIMKRYFEQRKLTPTKVLTLINLISPFEIDETLEEEVTEECFQFGNVVNLKIYVMSAEDCEDAVRIFVKYELIEEAMNAFTQLDGRIFNGRSVIGYFYSEDKFEENQLAEKLSSS